MAFVSIVLSLWLPILLSAVAVFVLSSAIHMFSPWHKSDYAPVPDQDRAMDTLRSLALPPGDYMIPRPASRADMSSPEFREKMKRGPNWIITVMRENRSMAAPLIGWFLYTLAVSAITGIMVMAGAFPDYHPHRIFHFALLTAFTGYVIALWQMSIWFHRKWSTTIKATIDGLIYAIATAAIFAHMWPM